MARQASFQADWHTWTTGNGLTDLVVDNTNYRTPAEVQEVGVIASLKKANAFVSHNEHMRAQRGEVISEDDTGELLAALKALWLRQVQSGRAEDDPVVSQADWHDARDMAEAFKRGGWGDSGQYRHHDTMFFEEQTPGELRDLAAALGTSPDDVQRRSRRLRAQESRLFEAMRPGFQCAVNNLTGQAREKGENIMKFMKVALRDWPLKLLVNPSHSAEIERLAPGILRHPKWLEWCQSVQEISAAVRERHRRIMAISSFELH